MNQWHQSVSVSAVQLIFASFLGHICVYRRQIGEVSVLLLGNYALALESAASVDAPEGETYWKLIVLQYGLQLADGLAGHRISSGHYESPLLSREVLRRIPCRLDALAIPDLRDPDRDS